MYQQSALLYSIGNELQREQDLYHQLQQRQQQLPSGYLAHINDHLYRVVRTPEETKQLIIPSSWNGSRQLIKELQEKRYIAKALPVLQNNLKALNKFQKIFQIYDPESIRTSLPSCYADFDISALLLDGDICPKLWAASVYPKNTGYLKELKYQSEGGLLTRSKAEADIATKLEQNHLHFRYEPILYLGKHKASPDLLGTFWEHGRSEIRKRHDGKAPHLRPVRISSG